MTCRKPFWNAAAQHAVPKGALSRYDQDRSAAVGVGAQKKSLEGATGAVLIKAVQIEPPFDRVAAPNQPALSQGLDVGWGREGLGGGAGPIARWAKRRPSAGVALDPLARSGCGWGPAVRGLGLGYVSFSWKRGERGVRNLRNSASRPRPDRLGHGGPEPQLISP